MRCCLHITVQMLSNLLRLSKGAHSVVHFNEVQPCGDKSVRAALRQIQYSAK